MHGKNVKIKKKRKFTFTLTVLDFITRRLLKLVYEASFPVQKREVHEVRLPHLSVDHTHRNSIKFGDMTFRRSLQKKNAQQKTNTFI